MLSVNGRHTGLPTHSAAIDYRAIDSLKQMNGARQRHHHRHMWIITGPAGCGKSTVAQHLANELSIPYIEGDDFHPPSNKQKMAQGIPLTDADRWDWLISLREAAASRLCPTNSSTTKPHDGVVVTCSALKRKYRDVMRIAAYNNHNVLIHFIYLRVDEDILVARVKARQGHYMKSTMVHSQLEMLEEPDVEEQGRDVLEIDCQTSLTEVQMLVESTVREVLAEDV
ncbi:thermoresistant gluconokinase family protein [Lasallia pustulata]|nr:thermoresistant gluconokinase family protein [Lasallia pustulata]